MEKQAPNSRPAPDRGTDRPPEGSERPITGSNAPMSDTDRPAPTDMTGEGRLVFRVSAAGGAIPLEGAEVVVRTFRSLQDGSGGEVISVLYSGRDGKTETLTLPAPAKAYSLSPSRDGAPAPYSLYDADIQLEGFYNQSYTRIPVFDGITSVQSATMIPLPEHSIPDGVRPEGEQFFEGQSPNL